MKRSVGLVGGEQSSIHRLHAGGAGEGSHQPVVYTVHVVDVHTWQEPDGVPVYKVQHTDHTSENRGNKELKYTKLVFKSRGTQIKRIFSYNSLLLFRFSRVHYRYVTLKLIVNQCH